MHLLKLKKLTTCVVSLVDCEYVIGGTGICVVRRTQSDVAKDSAELTRLVNRLKSSYKTVYFMVESDRKQAFLYVL